MMIFIQYGCAVLLLLQFILHGLIPDSNTRRKQDKQPPAPVRRAKRPDFDTQDWQGIFFDNVFDEGLTGPRPEGNPLAPQHIVDSGDSPDAKTPPERSWSAYISRETLEDEIKSMNRQLQSSVTTASRFNSQYGEVRSQFSILSMLFAIVHQFDQEIRWKKYALDAQIAFAEASAKSRTPSKPSFENAKLRKLDLAELVRGGRIETKQRPQVELNWPEVVDRRTLMVRLEQALQEHLKPASASLDDLQNQADDVRRQAEIVAVIGQVLLQPGMDEAEDDSYREFAIDMRDAANDVVQGVKTNDFDATLQGIQTITKSCSDCHGEWR